MMTKLEQAVIEIAQEIKKIKERLNALENEGEPCKVSKCDARDALNAEVRLPKNEKENFMESHADEVAAKMEEQEHICTGEPPF